jgi:Rrf2 family protein
MLARHRNEGAVKVRDIADEEELPVKFLELILLELKRARIVDSVQGANGGYKLRREPSDVKLSEVIRLIDGPLAPYRDAEHLRELIARNSPDRALYQVFLDVRNEITRILDNTTVANLVHNGKASSQRHLRS